MLISEEERSAMIDEPERLARELHELIKQRKYHLITDSHIQAYRIEAQKIEPNIEWSPF